MTHAEGATKLLARGSIKRAIKREIAGNALSISCRRRGFQAVAGGFDHNRGEEETRRTGREVGLVGTELPGPHKRIRCSQQRAAQDTESA